MSALYEPLNIYKPVASHIGIVEGPFEFVSLLGLRTPWPFTTRMTVVQLTSGELFLHSPIAFDDTLAREVSALGRLRHLVSPNRGHYAHIAEWARAFPETVAWTSPGVRERAKSQRIDVIFQGDLDSTPPVEWADDVDQTIIPGAALDEVVFFHRESKTLILADTMMNFELGKLKQPYRMIARLNGIYAPLGGMPVDMRIAFWPSRRKVRHAVEHMLSWRPERIVISRGRCFESDAEKHIERTFAWAL